MSIVLFVGPSFPALHRLALPGITVRPPAAQGDLLRAVGDGARVIGLIDGVFGHEPAVWHKEILFALERGVRVLGAASMGALRAAELYRFGMEGVGTIFAAYRDGLLDADDEVALVHGPAELGWPALSEPMVNLRATLARLERRGLLSRAEAAQVAEALAARFYPERTRATFESVLAAVVGGTRASSLIEWSRRLFVDAKRIDAARLLKRLRTSPTAQSRVAARRIAVQRSAPLRALLRELDATSRTIAHKPPSLPAIRPELPRALRPWAVFGLFAADNDLARALIEDLEELQNAQLLNRLHVVGEIDSPDCRLRGRFFLVPADPSKGSRKPRLVIEGAGPRNTGDPQLLVEFLSWALPCFPACRRALLLWGHGAGLNLAIDEGARDALSIPELLEALAAGLAAHAPIDLVIFDACLMGMLELVGDLAPFARHLVASSEVVPACGLPYHRVLEAFAHRSSPRDVGCALIEAFIAEMAVRGERHARMLLARTDRAAPALEALSLVGRRLKDLLPRERDAVLAARLLARAPRAHDLVDTGDLLARLARMIPDAQLGELVGRAQEAIAECVLEVRAVEPTASVLPNGLTLWFPAQAGTFRLSRSEYAVRPSIRGPGAGWLAFLDALHGCDRHQRTSLAAMA